MKKTKEKLVRKELTFTESDYREIQRVIFAIWNAPAKYRLPFVAETTPKPKPFLEGFIKYMLLGDGKKYIAGVDSGVAAKGK